MKKIATLKEKWEMIKSRVEETPLLNTAEKMNVLEKLDSLLGEYLIEGYIPVVNSDGLSESEFVVFKEIVNSINETGFFEDIFHIDESKKLPEIRIRSEEDYKRAVNEILKLGTPNKEVSKLLALMDLAMENFDIKGVNGYYEAIREII